MHVCLLFLCGAALSRAGGTTAHLGAVTTVPHGCPALIRAVGITAYPGAVTTVPHGCPVLIRAVDTTGHGRQESPPAGTPDRHAIGRGLRPPNVGVSRAAGEPSEAVRLVAHTGLRESRPGYGLRQQRRLHALFGRAGYRSSIEIHIYVVLQIHIFSFVMYW
jgi:hypothetical protein